MPVSKGEHAHTRCSPPHPRGCHLLSCFFLKQSRKRKKEEGGESPFFHPAPPLLGRHSLNQALPPGSPLSPSLSPFRGRSISKWSYLSVFFLLPSGPILRKYLRSRVLSNKTCQPTCAQLCQSVPRTRAGGHYARHLCPLIISYTEYGKTAARREDLASHKLNLLARATPTLVYSSRTSLPSIESPLPVSDTEPSVRRGLFPSQFPHSLL